MSDPIRLRIVAALAGEAELSCKSIDLPVVKSTCTHHFRVLREAREDQRRAKVGAVGRVGHRVVNEWLRSLGTAVFIDLSKGSMTVVQCVCR